MRNIPAAMTAGPAQDLPEEVESTCPAHGEHCLEALLGAPLYMHLLHEHLLRLPSRKPPTRPSSLFQPHCTDALTLAMATCLKSQNDRLKYAANE